MEKFIIPAVFLLPSFYLNVLELVTSPEVIPNILFTANMEL